MAPIGLVSLLCWATTNGYKNCTEATTYRRPLEARYPYRVCYFTTWAQYRPPPANIQPGDVDPFLCTHIVIAFLWISEDGKLTFDQDEVDQRIVQGLTALKKINTNLKILGAVGGWNFGSEPFQRISASKSAQKTFAYSAVAFLRIWDLDGLDLDWEYPKEEDRLTFASLVKEIHSAFQKDSIGRRAEPLLLTAAVPAARRNIHGYDPLIIKKYQIDQYICM